MLKRKIMGALEEWKKEENKKCLLVKGARQIGKTYIIREFAKQNYDHLVELNFFSRPELKDIFDGNLQMDNLIAEISLKIPSARFVEGKTLLFLDEIQECGNARTALKFIAEDKRFDCIASGSMLGTSYKNTRSIPVGYEKHLEMYSLDFEEFLWAKGYDKKTILFLKGHFDKKQAVPPSSNETMLKVLREYAIVGGMPSVVNIYLRTGNFGEVHAEQEDIISSYRDDIAKYAPGADKPKARDCYQSIPDQLAKENKKFQYSVVEEGSNARKYANNLEWLRDAGLVKFCVNVTLPELPLSSYREKNFFKVYLTDIGLLNAMYGFEMKNSFYNNTLKGPAKGGIYENLIADILLKKGHSLFYYKPKEGVQEIEFLLTNEKGIIPVEVKAGNGRTVSLDEYIKRYDPPYALKFISGNIGEQGKKLTLPLYMAMFLEDKTRIGEK
jgi:predicted AAA+ superfamily ATPase